MTPAGGHPDLGQLAAVLADLDAVAPAALVEIEGGSSPSYRIDLADGSSLVLKTYDDIGPRMPGSEVYAASLLAALDLPVKHYLAVDETRERLPFRFADEPGKER